MSRMATVGLIISLILCGSSLIRGQDDQVHDTFYSLIQLNKAQLVMLKEQGLVSPALARNIAQALKAVDERESRPGSERSSDYLKLEEKLIEMVGPLASNIHMGRSRNDLGTSFVRMAMREHTLVVLERMQNARSKVVDLAAAHVRTVIPAYTHAVQAQPISLAHYLLALDSSLERSSQQLRETYARVNRSTLGSAALGTSGFSLNRVLLAELVGFNGLVENSYDSIAVSSADSKVELANVFATSAISLGRFAQSLVVEYGDPAPWIYLGDNATGRSSIMPQKRNPGSIESLRRVSSEVIGRAHILVLNAHNTPFTEVGDVRYALRDRLLEVAESTKQMYALLERVLDGLVVRPERSLAKVKAEYSTMTELADALLREAGVSFRVGHHVASELTTYGREHGKTPTDLSYQEVERIYREVAGKDFPLNPSQLTQALDPEYVVFNRKGIGGPQPAESNRMIGEHRQIIAAHESWIQDQRDRLERAEASLDRAFNQLMAD